MTREEMEVLRDYIDSVPVNEDGTYNIKLTRGEQETLVSALDEVINF